MSWDQKLTQLFFSSFSFFFKSRYVCAAGTGRWHTHGQGTTLLKVYLPGTQRVKRGPHCPLLRGQQGVRRPPPPFRDGEKRGPAELLQCRQGWTQAQPHSWDSAVTPCPGSSHHHPVQVLRAHRPGCLCLEYVGFLFSLLSGHLPLFLSGPLTG